jgi:alpha-L-rhamnosidase
MKFLPTKNLAINLTVFLTVVFSASLLFGQPKSVANAANLQSLFQTPPDDSKIMMRWWWFGPAVTTEEIEREMRAMKAGGIGGFELAVVYPMTLDDPARGLKNERYLSPEFLEKVRFASKKAKEIGLRMDITIGSGWSFGGPYINQDLAAARLRSDSFEIAPSKTSVARPVPYEGEKLIGAFVGRASKNENPNTFQEIDISGAGELQIPVGDGPRTLVFYYSSHTGQIVKRSALGAEGYVLDHYNRAAIEKHLQEAGDKLLAAVEPGSVYSIFCDSLEVYGGDWTADLLPEFKKRRGYDLRPLLPLLEFDDKDRSEALRRDFGKTLSELYEERFLVPMKEWAAKKKVLFRVQNYGIPPASISSSRHADIIDGEGYHWRTLTATRWASSASHLFGKPVSSAESWTWIHSPAFRATPLDMKAEADQQFLNGVNQLIGHGWTYSPPQVTKPGWMFYAAGVLTDQNPWWAVMPDLSAYLNRVSFMMRQGEPVADIALYAPNEDAWSMFKPGTLRYLNLWAKTGERIGDNIIPAILDAGFNFDVIDDGTLAEAKARRYKAIVLPNVRWMPDATKVWLADYVKNGGKVYAVNRQPEGNSTFELVNEKDLTVKLAGSVTPDISMKPFVSDIGVVHRQLPDADIYFLANTTNQPQNVSVRFRSPLPNAELWNAYNGQSEKLAINNGEIAVNFEPYGSRIVIFRKDASQSVAPTAIVRTVKASEELRSGWNVALTGAANTDNIDLPYSWSDNSAAKFFSGTAVFTKKMNLPDAFREPGTRVFLDFGEAKPSQPEPLPGGTLRGNSFAALVAPPIREAATIFINGKRVGSLWSPPYKIDVTDFLQNGANEVKIEVYNTAINQLAEGGRIPDMNPLVEKYGLRTRLQDLENLKPLPSGIVSIPKLVAEK